MVEKLLLVLLLCTVQGYNFTQYAFKFNKHYKNLEEWNYRKWIFDSNLNMINMVNAQNRGYQLAVNNFTDWTSNEFRRYVGYRPIPEVQNASSLSINAVQDVPESVDWRTSGILTPIRDQGTCGSCWAFSTAALYQAYIAQKTSKLQVLSVEYLLECTDKCDCNGGSYQYSIPKALQHGVPLESDYPYKAAGSEKITPHTPGICQTNRFVYSPQNKFYSMQYPKLDQIKQVLTTGPVGIAVAAGQLGGFEFAHYSSGVFSCSKQTTPSDLNHAVVLVGYNNIDNYWIIRNSWGTTWGIDGYGYITQDQLHDCGASIIAYAIFDTKLLVSLLLLFTTIVL